MKNIRLYDAPKYNSNNYIKVAGGIYKTTIISEDNDDYFGLNGIVDEELVTKLSKLEGWEDGQTEADEDFQYLLVDGKTYYRDKNDPDDEDQEIWYYERDGVDPENVYVTSIMFEQEPEYGEKKPDDSAISQYPLEDILDKYLVYCLDDYQKENEEDSNNSYIEFAADRKKDIVKLHEIIGKHVYNKEDGDRVHLIVE